MKQAKGALRALYGSRAAHIWANKFDSSLALRYRSGRRSIATIEKDR